MASAWPFARRSPHHAGRPIHRATNALVQAPLASPRPRKDRAAMMNLLPLHQPVCEVSLVRQEPVIVGNKIVGPDRSRPNCQLMLPSVRIIPDVALPTLRSSTPRHGTARARNRATVRPAHEGRVPGPRPRNDTLEWRHHWASHCVMAGIDLITIMNMGGWKSLRMVQRYSSVSVDYMRESINKLD